MIEHIKNQKHSNFIQKLSKESSRINQENLRLVDKLNRAAVSVSSHSHRPPALSLTSLSYTVKRTRQKEIAKENSRIFHKLNNRYPLPHAAAPSSTPRRSARSTNGTGGSAID
jgi:aspartate-semialdehyde dehydrogenase